MRGHRGTRGTTASECYRVSRSRIFGFDHVDANSRAFYRTCSSFSGLYRFEFHSSLSFGEYVDPGENRTQKIVRSVKNERESSGWMEFRQHLFLACGLRYVFPRDGRKIIARLPGRNRVSHRFQLLDPPADKVSHNSS